MVAIALVIALGVIYGPGVIRAWKFRQVVTAFLSDVKSDAEHKVPKYVLAGQRQDVSDLLVKFGANQYTSSIENLKVANMMSEGDHMWAYVRMKFQTGGNTALGQAKLRWVLIDGQWKLDALGSYLAPFSVSADTNWISVAQYEDIAKTGAALSGFGE